MHLKTRRLFGSFPFLSWTFSYPLSIQPSILCLFFLTFSLTRQPPSLLSSSSLLLCSSSLSVSCLNPSCPSSSSFSFSPYRFSGFDLPFSAAPFPFSSRLRSRRRSAASCMDDVPSRRCSTAKKPRLSPLFSSSSSFPFSSSSSSSSSCTRLSFLSPSSSYSSSGVCTPRQHQSRFHSGLHRGLRSLSSSSSRGSIAPSSSPSSLFSTETFCTTFFTEFPSLFFFLSPKLSSRLKKTSVSLQHLLCLHPHRAPPPPPPSLFLPLSVVPPFLHSPSFPSSRSLLLTSKTLHPSPVLIRSVCRRRPRHDLPHERTDRGEGRNFASSSSSLGDRRREWALPIFPSSSSPPARWSSFPSSSSSISFSFSSSSLQDLRQLPSSPFSSVETQRAGSSRKKEKKKKREKKTPQNMMEAEEDIQDGKMRERKEGEEEREGAKGSSSCSPALPRIVLDEDEKKIFALLCNCVKDLQLNITLRAAGGWVRDKLLRRFSDDIDVAIDRSTGAEFAENLNKWFQMNGLPTHAIGVVASNPEQSKHLETATIRLLGHYQIDFVHLRTESYSSDSRIPETVGFGSPEEDANRRDFTLNALFYNLHTQQVEDYTRTGISDLQNRLLRTPLENSEATFLDDPLRVVRGIRLASILSLKLHRRVIQAARTRAVREALKKKVSRERIGIELRKMLSGADGEGGGGGKRTEHREGGGGQNKGGTNGDDVGSRCLTGEQKTEGFVEASQNGGQEAARAGEQRERERIRRSVRSGARGFALMVYLRVVDSIFCLPPNVFLAASAPQKKTAEGGEGQKREKEDSAQTKKKNKKGEVPSSENKQITIGGEEGWWREGLRSVMVFDHLFSSSSFSSWAEDTALRSTESFWCTDSSFLRPSSPPSEGENQEILLLAQELTKSLFVSPKKPSSVQEKNLPQDCKERKRKMAEKTDEERVEARKKGGVGEQDEKNEKKEKKKEEDQLLNGESCRLDPQWRDRLRVLSLSVMLSPLFKFSCFNEKKKPENLLFYLIVTGLKLSRKDAESAVSLNQTASRFLRYLSIRKEEKSEERKKPSGPGRAGDDGPVLVTQKEEEEEKERREREERVGLGLIIRDSKGMWREALLLAFAIQQQNTKNAGERLLEATPSGVCAPLSGVYTPHHQKSPEKKEDHLGVVSDHLSFEKGKTRGDEASSPLSSDSSLVHPTDPPHGHSQKHKLSAPSSASSLLSEEKALPSSRQRVGAESEEDRESKKARGREEEEEKQRREGEDGDENDEEEREVEDAFLQAMGKSIDLEGLREAVALKRRIEALKLSHVDTELVPLCDGHRIQRLLKNLPKGPVFKEILDDQVRWQLGNPDGSAEEFEAYLARQYSAYV